MTGLWGMAALAVALSGIAPGWWQVRTIVQGDRRLGMAMHCLLRAEDATRAILPAGITVGCDPRGICRGGGSLELGGRSSGDRFDLIAHRTGPIANLPHAVALLHLEGRRVAATCPTSPSAP